MAYNIDQIRSNPINRENAKLMPELMRYARADLDRASRMPHTTKAQEKAKLEAITNAQRVLDERTAKLDAYRKAFPEMFT